MATPKTGGFSGPPISLNTAAKYATPDKKEKPPYPTGLKLRGKKAWDAIWNEETYLQYGDYMLAEEYCYLADEIERYRKMASKEEPFIYIGENGAMQPHSILGILRDARAQLITLQNLMMLSPSARIKADIEKAKVNENNILAKFVNRSMARDAKREVLDDSKES